MNYVLTNWFPEMYKMNTSDQFFATLTNTFADCTETTLLMIVSACCTSLLCNNSSNVYWIIMALPMQLLMSSSRFVSSSSLYLSYFLGVVSTVGSHDSEQNKRLATPTSRAKHVNWKIMWSSSAAIYHGNKPTCVCAIDFDRSEYNQH